MHRKHRTRNSTLNIEYIPLNLSLRIKMPPLSFYMPILYAQKLSVLAEFCGRKLASSAFRSIGWCLDSEMLNSIRKWRVQKSSYIHWSNRKSKLNYLFEEKLLAAPDTHKLNLKELPRVYLYSLIHQKSEQKQRKKKKKPVDIVQIFYVSGDSRQLMSLWSM